MKSFLANYDFLGTDIIESSNFPLSYLSKSNDNTVKWQRLAREKITDLLSFAPEAKQKIPLNATVDKKYIWDGLTVEHISYEMPYGPRAEGILLRPQDADGKLSCVVALHDHGGFKYYGKEKITDLPDSPDILVRFKATYYSGQSWANNLAKLGFAVFIPDVFLWGSRKMNTENLPQEFTQRLMGKVKDSEEYINSYNDFAAEYESIIAKTLFLAGTTWPGIMVNDDMRALDYLCTRDDIDCDRIGCGGLSGGGLRTIFLAGLDSRIKCSVCSGFMSTLSKIVKYNVSSHTWMLHLPSLPKYMDLPDIISISANPVMVQYNKEDELMSMEGQNDADERLSDIYDKFRTPEKYKGIFYDGSHKFDIEMQNDAFAWYKKWLTE